MRGKTSFQEPEKGRSDTSRSLAFLADLRKNKRNKTRKINERNHRQGYKKKCSTSLFHFFTSSHEYRSDSDTGEYGGVVQAFVKNHIFDNFKRNQSYLSILEHVTKQQGEAYLQILKEREDGILEDALSSVLISDSVGNPKKFFYNGIDFPLSPTTLRYAKVASDLNSLFGKGVDHVAEIGCGYGGQCLANEKLLGYNFATLFDLPVVNELIKRYLNYTLMRGAYETAAINEKLPQKYDLALSNYAFSELPKAVQEIYIRKVLAHSGRGYLTMNSGTEGNPRSEGKLSVEDLQELLPPFVVLEEDPLTGIDNYIVVWGHDEETARTLFRQKS